MNMKRYFLTFCTLGLEVLTSLWVCAQSETTVSEKAEKNPGDQLIEFLQNLPSKYELGVESRLAGFNSSNPYHKIKKDNSNFFYGRGANSSFITSNNINDWGNFYIICNKDNEYWRLSEKYLTTWTNKGEKSDLENTTVRQWLQILQSSDSFLLVIPGLKKASWTDSNHFSITNSHGEIIGTSSLVRNEEGYILKQILTNPPQPLNTSNGKKMWNIGEIYEYSYDKNFEVPFFPKVVTQYRIRKVLSDEEESVRTNVFETKNFYYLNLDPKFDSKSFSLEQFGTNTLHQSRFWLSGTNELYIDTNTQQILRVMEAGESQWPNTISEKANDKYQGHYNFWKDLKNMMDQ